MKKRKEMCFNTKSQLKFHNQSNHGQLIYNCDFCEDKLKSKALPQLKCHNQGNHEWWIYNCDFCEDKLKSKGFWAAISASVTVKVIIHLKKETF